MKTKIIHGIAENGFSLQRWSFTDPNISIHGVDKRAFLRIAKTLRRRFKMENKIESWRHHPSINSNPEPNNPIVVKEHSCSGCGKKWKETIHQYGGTYAYCKDCSEKEAGD